MEPSLIIPSDRQIDKRISNSFLVLIIVALLAGTFLRVSLLLLYPLVALMIGLFYKFKVNSSLLILLGLVCFSFLLSFGHHTFFRYKLLSLLYMLPFLLLLFSDPVAEKNTRIDHLSVFIRCLTIVALVNDLIGFVQVIRTPDSDDSFIGIYSQYSVSLNGLMLLNAVLFYYYFVRFLADRKLSDFIPTVFFICCALLGFYGAGMIICTAAFILSFFRFRPKDVIRTFTIAFASLGIIYFGMLFVKPQVLQYNIENLQKIVTFDHTRGPRKIASFYNYAVSYPRNVKDFLFGSGPGTFNSRSAFIVGSPTYFQALPFIKDKDQPYYFKNYAYTLWNENNTVKSLYLDGFRNQPFSSILAFLGEYGLLFTITFLGLYYLYYRRVAAGFTDYRKEKKSTAYFRLFKFLMILLPLLLLIDNYFEYPEIMLIILLGIKFSHAGLLTTKQNLSRQ